jgi:hypothetical protein
VIYRRPSGKPPRLLLRVAVTAGVGAIVGGVACHKEHCMGLCADDEDDVSMTDASCSESFGGCPEDGGGGDDARVMPPEPVGLIPCGSVDDPCRDGADAEAGSDAREGGGGADANDGDDASDGSDANGVGEGSDVSDAAEGSNDT